jgi:hypothetical protein
MYVRTLESGALYVLSMSFLCMLGSHIHREDIDRTYRALDSKVLTYIEKTLTELIELLIKSSICYVNVFSMYVRTLESRGL